jgi:hypothetical protein
MKPETKAKNDRFSHMTDVEKAAHRKAKNQERHARNLARRAVKRKEAEARRAAAMGIGAGGEI